MPPLANLCYHFVMSIDLDLRAFFLAALLMTGTMTAVADDSLSNDPGPGLPTGLCKAIECSPVHEDAWARFQTGTAVDDLSLPALYSGICWVMGPGYNANHRHHVGLLIDQLGDRVAMGLRLSFFSKKQPFIELDRKAATRFFDDTPMPMVYGDGYGFAEANEKAPFRYWVRRDGATPDKLSMVGFFGFRHTILCSLRDNASYR